MFIKKYEINIYDILKVIAIVTMITDHIGYFFIDSDQALWYRIIGRISMPLFLLLVGYSHSKKIHDFNVISMAFIIDIVRYLCFGLNNFFFHILWSILLVRLYIFIGEKYNYLTHILFALLGLLLYGYTHQYIEYGTVALSFGILGIMRRYYNDGKYYLDNKLLSKYIIIILSSIIITFYTYTQQSIFGFSYIGSLYIITFLSLCVRRLVIKNNSIISSRKTINNIIISYVSRYSLWIYVTHLILFIMIYKELHK